MKKFKTLLTALVMLVGTSAFANNPENVSPKVKEAFANDFSKANKVTWEKTEEFYFANFELAGSRIEAAYDENGKLLGTSRSIAASQMPLQVSLSIADQYAGYQLSTSVLELSLEGQTRYYVTISNQKQVIQLKCLANGDLEVESKKRI